MIPTNRSLLAIAVLLLLGGCTRQGTAEVTPACVGGAARLRGVVVDVRSSVPLAHALIALSNPALVHGAQADEAGRFSVELPCGAVELFAFSPGYACGVVATEAGDSVRVAAERLDGSVAPPHLSEATLEPSTVARGGTVTIRARVTAGTPGDPLSERVLAVAPALGQSLMLEPPGALPRGFADGEWKRSFTAPGTPGTYTYHLVAASESCAVGGSVPLTLTVH